MDRYHDCGHRLRVHEKRRRVQPPKEDLSPPVSTGGSNLLLAFVVTTDAAECSIVVCAENRSEAKSIARGSDWFSDEEWIDLRVKREPKADAYAEKFGKGWLECRSVDEQRLLRALGWHQLEHTHEQCSKCHLHEWELVPESKLAEVGDSYVCAGCRKANAKLSERRASGDSLQRLVGPSEPTE